MWYTLLGENIVAVMRNREKLLYKGSSKCIIEHHSGKTKQNKGREEVILAYTENKVAVLGDKEIDYWGSDQASTLLSNKLEKRIYN